MADNLYIADTPKDVSSAKGLHLITQNTPNGQATQILLEELASTYGTQFTTTVIDISTNVQKNEWFLRLNPNGRIPTLVDNSQSPPFPVIETSAQLLYLVKFADKDDTFGFKDELERNEALQWMFFWHGGGAPYQGQVTHFTRVAPEKIEYAINRFRNETLRVFGVLEIRLSGKYTGEPRDYLAGKGKGKYSVADIKAWPWIKNWERSGFTKETMHQDFPHLLKWIDRIAERPAVQAGIGDNYALKNPEFSVQTQGSAARTGIKVIMDFKSLMSAQISKSKPASGSSSSTASSKYLRRAEIEVERQAAYQAEQNRLEAEREERTSKKRKLEEEEAEKDKAREAKLRKLAEESKARRQAQDKEEERQRRKRLGLPALPDTKDDEGTPLPEGETDIADEELRSKMRDLGEPTVLFGESHVSRLKRYRTLTGQSLAPKLSNGPIPTTLEPVEEKDMLLPDPLPKENTSADQFLLRQLGSYFTLLLTEWAVALSQRDTAVKESASGRAAYNSYSLVVRDLTPLFRQLESKTLSRDLLSPICEIVRAAQHRRYVDANDGYLRLSIGKAAWPIGVTMVGIHERSAREKLHETDKQAHIMADEVTRKILQSLKRCLSFAQTRWPPKDIGQLMG